MSYARRVDGNHAEIRDGLRAAGYTVLDLSKAACGIPDILALSKCGASVFMEIKMPGEKLTDAERKFHAIYTGLCCVVFSLEDALDKLEKIDERAGYDPVEDEAWKNL
jgi:hypothetical protein